MMVEWFIYRCWTRCPRAPSLTKLSLEGVKSPINSDPLPASTECVSSGRYELKEKGPSSFYLCHVDLPRLETSRKQKFPPIITRVEFPTKEGSE